MQWCWRLLKMVNRTREAQTVTESDSKLVQILGLIHTDSPLHTSLLKPSCFYDNEDPVSFTLKTKANRPLLIYPSSLLDPSMIRHILLLPDKNRAFNVVLWFSWFRPFQQQSVDFHWALSLWAFMTPLGLESKDGLWETRLRLHIGETLTD